MLKEDRKLKRYLVLQSFSPLFVLILIKHIGGYGDLILKFIKGIFCGDFSVWSKAMNSHVLGDVIVTMICMAWLIMTVIVELGFRNLQRSSYDHHGEARLIV